MWYKSNRNERDQLLHVFFQAEVKLCQHDAFPLPTH